MECSPGFVLLLWATALSASASASTPGHHTVQAFSRSDVLLSCEAPEDSDLENLALEWTRTDLQQFYVFMFRDGRPLKAFQHHHFKDRVELVDRAVNKGNLSIKIRDVDRSDSGQYQCHVFSKSDARKRSVLGTEPISTIELNVQGPEPKTIVALPGQDVVFPVDKLDFSVSSLMWKREDDPEHFVLLFGMGHPHHQHPLYQGRTELRSADQTENQDLNQALDHILDPSMKLRRVLPSDSGTYHLHIIQSLSHRTKRDLHQSEPYSVVKLKVLSSAALRVDVGAGFVATVLVSLILQIWE